MFIVLCAPLELSPSSLQFLVEPLAPPSDAYTKVSTRVYLQIIIFLPPSIPKYSLYFFNFLKLSLHLYWLSSLSLLLDILQYEYLIPLSDN